MHWLGWTSKHRHAGVAQLVEQLICNQQVGGSSPSTSSIPSSDGTYLPLMRASHYDGRLLPLET